MAIRALGLRVEAEDNASVKFNEIGNAAERMRERISRESGGFLEQLKGSAGRGSGLFEAGHLLEGGAPLIGARLITGELAKWAEESKKVAEGLRDGSLSAGEAGDKLARTVPILGQIYSAGRDIREIFLGEEAAAAAVTKEAGLINERIDFQRESLKEANKEYVEMRDILDSILNKEAGIGLAGIAASAHAARQAAAEEEDRINKKLIADRAIIEKGGDGKSGFLKQIQEIDTQLNKINIPEAIPLVTGSRVRAGHNVDTSNADEVAARNKEIEDAKTHQASLAAARKQLLKQQTDEEAPIIATANAARVANQRVLNEQLAEQEKQLAKQRAEEIYQGNQKVAAAEAQVHADRLKAAGKESEAEIVLIKSRAQAEADAIKHELAKTLASIQPVHISPFHFDVNVSEIKAGAQAALQAIKELHLNQQGSAAEVADAQRKASEEDAKRRSEINKELDRGEMFAVEEKAKAGDAIAKQELERLRILEDFNSKEYVLLQIEKDRVATAEQIKKAYADDTELKAARDAALANITKPDKDLARIDISDDASRLTGANLTNVLAYDNSAGSGSDKGADNAGKAADHAGTIADFFTNLLTPIWPQVQTLINNASSPPSNQTGVFA